MKREIILIVALCICLAGCGKDTMVYIPEEEAAEIEDGIVVYIPVDPERPTEVQAQPTEAETLAEATEPEPTYSATVSKKTGTSSGKSSSGNKSSATNKDTITGSGQKPAETAPTATEPGSQETVTIPAATELPATEPEVTEPLLYDISGYALGTLEYAMLDQINAHRADAGLGELTLDAQLSAIASCRSYEVSLVWSHTRPDGRSFAAVLGDYGYSAGSVEELLVYVSGFADGTAMADRWMQSDSHRQLLLGDWTAAGIGVYDANGFTYVTCLLVQ